MKDWKTLLGSLLLFMLLSASAHAKSKTGMDLKRMCNTDESLSSDAAYQNAAWCDGFVFGFLSFSYRPSIPDDVTIGQFELVLNKYMSEHPENLNMSAESIVRLTAISAWGKGGAK